MTEPATFAGHTRFDINEWPFSPAFQNFADFLGLSSDRDAKGINWRYDKKTADKIQKIYIWGMVKAKTNDYEKIKEEIYNLQRKIGVNWEGKTLVERLWQHTMFDANFNRQLRSLERKAQEEKENKVEKPRKVSRPTKSIPASSKTIAKAKPINDSVEELPDYSGAKIRNI